MATFSIPPALIAYALSLLPTNQRFIDLPHLTNHQTLQLTQNGLPVLGHHPSCPITRLHLHLQTDNSPAYELQVNHLFVDSATHHGYRFVVDLPPDHTLLQLIPPSPLSHLFPCPPLYQEHTLSLPETHQLIHYALPPDLHPLLSPHILAWPFPLTISHYFSVWPQPYSSLRSDTTIRCQPSNLPPDLKRTFYEHQDYTPLFSPTWRPHIPDTINHLLLRAILPFLPSPWITVYLSDHPTEQNPSSPSSTTPLTGQLYPKLISPTLSDAAPPNSTFHFLSSDRYVLLYNDDNSFPPYNTLAMLDNHNNPSASNPYVLLTDLLNPKKPHPPLTSYQNLLHILASLQQTLNLHTTHISRQALAC